MRRVSGAAHGLSCPAHVVLVPQPGSNLSPCIEADSKSPPRKSWEAFLNQEREDSGRLDRGLKLARSAEHQGLAALLKAELGTRQGLREEGLQCSKAGQNLAVPAFSFLRPGPEAAEPSAHADETQAWQQKPGWPAGQSQGGPSLPDSQPSSVARPH